MVATPDRDRVRVLRGARIEKQLAARIGDRCAAFERVDRRYAGVLRRTEVRTAMPSENPIIALVLRLHGGAQQTRNQHEVDRSMAHGCSFSLLAHRRRAVTTANPYPHERD